MSLSRHPLTSSLSSISLVALGLLLSACGGDNGNAPPAATTSTLSGMAAVGAAVQDATVIAKCADGSGFTTTVKTSTGGAWSGQVKSGVLPCALQISGGTPAVTLHSYATAPGNVNITTLTDLALAYATGQQPATWFTGYTSSTPAPALTTDLLDALADAGYPVPAGGASPFTVNFSIGSPWDVLLDKLGQGIEAAGDIADYAALVDLIRSGNLDNLPTAPEGGDDEEPGDDTPSTPLGLASFGHFTWGDLSNPASSNAELLAAVTGTHEVAIYRAPTGNEGDIGKGTLIISGTADDWSMQLKNSSGTVISSGNSKSVAYGAITPSIGMLFLNGGGTSSPDKYLSVTVTPEGQITGSAGGLGEYGFRNNIAGYGTAVPGVFAKLAGTYAGPQLANTCEKPPVTVTIAANGAVTNTGKGNLSCADATITNQWDGNDDFIYSQVISVGSWQTVGGSLQWVSQDQTQYVIQIDSAKGGGSQPQGGIQLITDSLDAPTQLFNARSALSGMAGNLEVNNPVKQ